MITPSTPLQNVIRTIWQEKGIKRIEIWKVAKDNMILEIEDPKDHQKLLRTDKHLQQSGGIQN